MTELIDTQQITLRLATPADERAVIRLAQRDSGRPPSAPLLLGFEGDRLLAAISLADGEVIADPFAPSASIVGILRSRAGQVDGKPSRRFLRHRRSPAARWATA